MRLKDFGSGNLGQEEGLGHIPREEKSEATPAPLFVLSSLEGYRAGEMKLGPQGGWELGKEQVPYQPAPHAGYLW